MGWSIALEINLRPLYMLAQVMPGVLERWTVPGFNCNWCSCCGVQQFSLARMFYPSSQSSHQAGWPINHVHSHAAVTVQQFTLRSDSPPTTQYCAGSLVGISHELVIANVNSSFLPLMTPLHEAFSAAHLWLCGVSFFLLQHVRWAVIKELPGPYMQE